MKIYTKAGDKGATQVYTSDMLRVNKDNAILECYGTLDELNSHIGLLAALISNNEALTTKLSEKQSQELAALEPAFLQKIQQDLFAIGFAISDKPQIDKEATVGLEVAIDNLQSQLSPQTKFILPGGSVLASQAHVARTVARRAERQLVSLALQQQNTDNTSVGSEPVPEECLSYLNRLSDFLFVVARVLNMLQQFSDVEV